MRFLKLTRIPLAEAALVFALMLAAEGSAPAEVLVSSLNNTSSFVNFGPNGWAGSSFKTDTNTWTLTSATVTLELGAPTSSEASVHLLSDAGGKPGASLADLGTKTVVGASAPVTFTAATSVTLSPATTYWIAVGNVGTNGGLNVRLLDSGASFTVSGAAGATMTSSISGGGGTGTNPPAAWNPSTPGMALLFAVEGTRGLVPPEPRPTLTIAHGPAQRVYVTWPTNFTGFSLQSATNLPATVWNTMTNAPTVISNQFAQVIDPTAGIVFYRLRK